MIPDIPTVPTAPTAPAVAWYGKLPGAGDFASRRLGAAFVEAWDGWLAAGLAAWRRDDPDWLAQYLAAPSWRFVLAPRAVHRDSPWLAGVLMPSVDRVGRYFPLTLVQPLAGPPRAGAPAQALLDGLHRLNDVALDALDGDWGVAQLEAALAAFGSLAPATPARPAASAGTHPSPASTSWPSSSPASIQGAPVPVPTPLGDELAARTADGCSVWWHADADGATWSVALRRLPGPSRFAWLLTGHAARPAADGASDAWAADGGEPDVRVLTPLPSPTSSDPSDPRHPSAPSTVFTPGPHAP